ncbi:MAG TPA: hypothetical protein VEJ39_08955 [Candidatus Acidoferrales bacterium]|nr:hypothetical protein [Candidatus Acidoferrales bacterium]
MKPKMELEKPRPASRRSQRLKLQFPVFITVVGSSRRTSTEETITLNVNAWGGLFELRMPVELSDAVIVTNKSTAEEQEARVAYVGPVQPHGRKIGVEFIAPAKDFWRIHFPSPLRSNGSGNGNGRNDIRGGVE